MTGRIHGLDALRGIAAWLVLLMHASQAMAGAHLAVDFFFMLSGFVMARTYEDRLRDKSLNALSFLVKRYRRLWFTMAVGASLGLALHLWVIGPSAGLALAYLAAILLVPYSAATPYLLNGPAWSITYELLANALHGLWLAKLGDHMLWAALLATSVAFVAAYIYAGFPRILQYTTVEMQLFVIFRAMTAYLIGILMSRLTLDRALPRLPFWVGAVALPAYIAMVTIDPFEFWPLPFVFLIAPLTILAGLDREAPKGPSAFLGDISFPLYAVHMPIVQAGFHFGWPRFTAVFLSVAVACLWVFRLPERRTSLAT